MKWKDELKEDENELQQPSIGQAVVYGQVSYLSSVLSFLWCVYGHKMSCLDGRPLCLTKLIMNLNIFFEVMQ